MQASLARSRLIRYGESRRGFFCYGEQKCALSISSSTVPTAHCSGGSTVDLATLSIPYTTTESSSVATISTFSVYAPLLQLMYQSSDVSTTTSSSSSITPISSGTETDSSGSRRLSTGASAGIGVGVGLGVVIVAGAAFWSWRMKRKNMKAAASDQRSNPENFRDSRPGVLDAKSPLELQGYNTVPEIDSHTRLEELEGDGGNGPRVDIARGPQNPPVELA